MTNLRDYYTTANRLHIQRISGELLPMDQCYINLAVMKSLSSGQGNSANQSSPFSLSAHLNIETTEIYRLVYLSALFKTRRSPDGTDFTPKRILIRGRAGIGKTTLCKKIVSDYLHHDMWHQLFELLLWIPLRRLKGRSSEKTTIVDLFHDLYFSEFEEGKSLANDLWETVKDSTKTLFILDGLDEVSQEWDFETPMNKILLHLLNQPRVIITSRPYGMNLDNLMPLDLELETIGFNSRQVESYIRNIERRYPKKVDNMLSFIQSYPLIQDLVRIPIQLDAMCYSWDSSFMSDEPKTMTTLYQAITLKLWQKDIVRLGKSDPAKHLNEHSIQALSPLRIQGFVSDEINFLETIAFIGIYNNIIEFNASDRHRIRDCLADTLPDVSDTTLKKISFLHTSDITIRDQDRSYHFLHLTFQEFFAARYFVKHWVNRQEILCLELRQRSPRVIRIKPRDFIEKEKLNSRCGILWRFVAGILQGVSTDEQETARPLNYFFQELEAGPCDLLGPAHQRILMHCLSEVVSDLGNDFDLRLKIENRVQQWLLFECDFHNRIYLGEERECPEHLLKSLLQRGQFRVKKALLSGLYRRKSILSQSFLETVILLLKHENSNVKFKAAQALGKQNLPQAILEALVPLLKDKNSNIKYAAAQALGGRNLPQAVLEALVPLLKDKKSGIRSEAAQALGKQNLPPVILEALVLLLKDKNSDIKYAAAQALGQQSLPQSITEALVPLLKDENSGVRYSAAQALGKQNLPQIILEELVRLLKDEDIWMRYAAAQALGQQNLPQAILEALVPLLKDKDAKYAAAQALGQQNLPQEILAALVPFLKDKDAGHTAAQVLSEKFLPQTILEALVPLLSSDAGYAAVMAIGDQNLQPAILEALVPLLEDNNAGYAAAKALSEEDLPQPILKALVPLLKDESSGVKSVALTALGQQSSPLPHAILESLVPLLNDEHSHVRYEAARTLGQQSIPLPQEIVQALSRLLKDGSSDVKSVAAEALGHQSTPLPQAILEALVPLLGDRNSNVRSWAARALGQQSTLPRAIIEGLVSLIQGESKYVDAAAETVLRKHSEFYSMLPNLNSQSWKCLYTVWLRKSFREQLSCSLRDNILYINMPGGSKEVIFEKHNQEEFKRAVHEVQLVLGVPSWNTPYEGRSQNEAVGSPASMYV
jgi:HEAT repeat protein